MIKILRATLTVEGKKTLSEKELEEIVEKLSEIGFLDKLYGAACEMLREHFGHDVTVSLEE